MLYISLGSNCSVTWWLNKLELRKQAYPFDWCSLTIKHLNTILKNNFDEYIETLKINFLSDKYPNECGEPSMVITNRYNIRYAHEVVTDDIEDFKTSLNNRIMRFQNLDKEDLIIYVRIELSIIKIGYINELKELIKLLNLINPNYIIKLIIHKDSIKINLEKVKIYYFDKFTPDWKMEHIDWNNIFTSSS
jgi:hypothetical protein